MASLIKEYISFPTNTLYVVEEMSEISSPAITMCLKNFFNLDMAGDLTQSDILRAFSREQFHDVPPNLLPLEMGNFEKIQIFEQAYMDFYDTYNMFTNTLGRKNEGIRRIG